MSAPHLLVLAALGLATWAAILAGLLHRQARLAFGQPWRIRPAPPGPHAGAHVCEDLPHVTADGVRLEGWQARPLAAPAQRWVLYFGGRNENTAWAPGLAAWLGPGWGVRVCNYRGFAGSGGLPCEADVVADGRAMAEALMRAHGLTPERLLLVGRSLGATVAVQVAATLPGAGLVLFTPPASLAAIVARRWLLRPALPWLHQRFDALRVAPQVRGPALVLLAERDTFVPHDHSRALAAGLGGAVTVETIPATGHLSLPRHPRTLARVARWVNEHAPTAAR